MVPVRDREVAESAPTHLSFGVIFFFFYINLIIMYVKIFLHLRTQKRKQNDKDLMSKKRNNNEGNDQ